MPGPSQYHPGCCSGTLLVIGVALALAIAAWLAPWPEPSAPAGAIAFRLEISPDELTAPRPPDGLAASMDGLPPPPAVVRITDAELSALLARRVPGGASVQASTGLVRVRLSAGDRVAADGWLAPDKGRLRLYLRSLIWRGVTVTRWSFGMVEGQLRPTLEGMFPVVEVAGIAAGDGWIEMELRPAPDPASARP